MSPRSSTLFDHIALALPRVEDAMAVVVGVLGGVPHHGGPGLGFRGGQWTFANGGKLEVLEPDGSPDSFLRRFVEKHGPRIHHLTFKVPDLRAATARAEELGFEIVGFNDAFPAWKEAFLHPKQAGGIVLQFAESHPELGGNWNAQWGFPGFEGPIPAPASLLGIELAAPSEAHALTVYRDVLGGAMERDGDGRMVFRWEHSPMIVAIHVDADAEPGPRALEVDGEGRSLEGAADARTQIGIALRVSG